MREIIALYWSQVGGDLPPLLQVGQSAGERLARAYRDEGRATMTELRAGWELKGVYNEACASEGQCPYYFGRDKEGGCRYFMAFRITQGKVGDVDLSGITAIYMGDLPHATYAEVVEKGSEGAIYLSDNATSEQRAILDTLAVEALGGGVMKRVFGPSLPS